MGVLLLVGTRKGLFLVRGDDERRSFEVDEPVLPGWQVNHAVADPRDGSLYACANSWVYGGTVQRSTDGGATWTRSEGLGLPEESGLKLASTWHLEPGHASQPGTLWLGGEPGVLFRSDDSGASWQVNEALLGHETRDRWQPGAGGMCLHTILIDPKNHNRIFVAISAAGTFRSDDSGNTWKPINRGLHSEYIPDSAAEVGHCVHRIAMHHSRPNVLFMQKHWDVMRSNDAGDSWHEVSGNLPSDFGFVIDVHAHEPETIYVIPIKSDSEHYPPDGKLRVYRSRSGGNEWEALTKGLPQSDCYVNVLRDAMAVDSLHPCGIYFGTTGGQVYASADSGDSWAPIVRDLPAVLSVEVQTLPS